MSNRSRPAVHPLEVEIDGVREEGGGENGVALQLPDENVRMKDVQGMPGTTVGLVLRVFQFAFAAVSVGVMGATSDFPSVTAFRYLVAALSLQCLWSLSLAIVDIYALLVKRSLRNSIILGLFTIGDAVNMLTL
ncbi:CASP-like protein 5A2 [Tanacetum coccineum]